mmetsp:Transcript_14860/g.36378  ORF Transcript_14860/g.36378 Transcript_14860/m.36378 type:complete len:209 (-) Transcript_14860:131-757(-)
MNSKSCDYTLERARESKEQKNKRKQQKEDNKTRGQAPKQPPHNDSFTTTPPPAPPHHRGGKKGGRGRVAGSHARTHRVRAPTECVHGPLDKRKKNSRLKSQPSHCANKKTEEKKAAPTRAYKHTPSHHPTCLQRDVGGCKGFSGTRAAPHAQSAQPSRQSSPSMSVSHPRASSERSSSPPPTMSCTCKALPPSLVGGTNGTRTRVGFP